MSGTGMLDGPAATPAMPGNSGSDNPGSDNPGSGNPGSDNPGGGAPSGSPSDGAGTPSGSPAPPTPDNSETVTPVGPVDPGMGAGTGSGSPATEAEGAGAPPADEPAPPVGEPAPPVEEPDPPVEEPPPPVEAFVEDSGLDCAVGQIPATIPANQRLPDPFVRLDGTRVTTRADWRCRRKELRAMAERFVYGTKPPKPESVTGSVTNTQITVNVSNGGNNTSFSSTITLPTTGQAPFPAVFSVGGSDQNLFLSQGVAIINFNPNTVGTERQGGGSQANRQNKAGAFYTIYGNTSPTGLLAAWAWGVSRYIDVIEAADGSIIRKDAFAVMGCSRNGKAAFAIGALDERIALTVPFESGTAGVPLLRAVAQGEVGDNGQPSQSLSAAFGEQAWFGDAFGAFLSSANTLPMDTHEIIGLFAPRGLLVLDNPFIGELTPRGAHAAALAGAEIYEALGVRGNIGYHSNTGSGTHCAIRTEYQEPLRQAIQRHLLGNEGAADAAIQVSQTFATANPQDWIDWETPTLE